MRFIDEAIIEIQAGHGGAGKVSFWREKWVPMGGPDGGDGGAGGSVRFRATSNLSTLQDFRYRRAYRAPDGERGGTGNCAGRDGEDVTVLVPVGTIVREFDSRDILFDFTQDGQEWFVCRGGRGGKGNAHFTTSTFQAPKFAQPGEAGEKRKLVLELKLIADIAIIGFPNAGKSTLISRVSAAHPKIADYPFTTRVPNLGVVDLGDHQSCVFADIPGLVEGAHEGYGLGHQFLRHIERTRAFLHLIDPSILLYMPEEQALPELVREYEAIRNELGIFNPSLLHKPEIVVLNKADILPPELAEKARLFLRQNIASIRGTHPAAQEPFLISAAAGTGLKGLLETVKDTFPRTQSKPVALPDDPGVRFQSRT